MDLCTQFGKANCVSVLYEEHNAMLNDELTQLLSKASYLYKVTIIVKECARVRTNSCRPGFQEKLDAFFDKSFSFPSVTASHWKRCSGVLCDRRMPVKLKGKVYKTVVRPALLYGAETWATTRGQEARQEVNEMRMLRWMCGVTRRDKIRNEHIRGTTRVGQASKKITEKRLKWYGHVRRMKEEHIVRRMLDVDPPRKRRRGRPSLRWKDACKRDMTQAGLKEDNATNRAIWRKKLISYTGDPR